MSLVCTFKNKKLEFMKKLMLCAALAAFGLSNVNAQEMETPDYGFTQGNVFVEGNLGYNSTNDKNLEVKTKDFTVNPKVGYFLSDDLAVGLEVNYLSSTKDVAGTDTVDYSGFGAGVFARYYFLDLGKRFKTYSELGVGYGTAKNDLSDVKVNGVNAGLSLGINYFLTDNIAISFGLADVLSYNTTKVDVDGAESVNEFNANINIFNNFFDTAQFGLLYKF